MYKPKLKKKFISLNLIFPFIINGLIGFLIIDNGIIENVNANILTVNDDGGADYFKIQDAIDNATSGDTIYVWEGVYYENIIINKTITLIGNGTINTTIDGRGNDNVLLISAN